MQDHCLSPINKALINGKEIPLTETWVCYLRKGHKESHSYCTKDSILIKLWI